jgi:hypothetical protein
MQQQSAVGIAQRPGLEARYFLIGAMLNVPRFLILGMVIGYLYKRLDSTEVGLP